MNKKDENLIQRYYNNEKIADICKNGGTLVYKTLKKYNLPKRKPIKYITNHKGNSNVLFKLSQKKVEENIIKFNARSSNVKYNTRQYEILCDYCNSYYFTNEPHIRKCINENKKKMCTGCRNKIANEIRAKGKKSKANTSGYIGVSLIHGKKFIGVSSTIMHNKIRVLNNKYKDEFLQDKTIIQSALDRDIFIIEHNLPHRRNFTNTELFANMEYLAYEQIDHIKSILSS